MEEGKGHKFLSWVVIEPTRAGAEESIQGLDVLLGYGRGVSRGTFSNFILKGWLHIVFGGSTTNVILHANS